MSTPVTLNVSIRAIIASGIVADLGETISLSLTGSFFHHETEDVVGAVWQTLGSATLIDSSEENPFDIGLVIIKNLSSSVTVWISNIDSGDNVSEILLPGAIYIGKPANTAPQAQCPSGGTAKVLVLSLQA
jgi:hypothetical protein